MLAKEEARCSPQIHRTETNSRTHSEGEASRQGTRVARDLVEACAQVEEIIGREVVPSGHIPSPWDKKVLELSLREARQIGTKWYEKSSSPIREGEGVPPRCCEARDVCHECVSR